jgi:predicted SprT family Zn-dependent metalloprotease
MDTAKLTPTRATYTEFDRAYDYFNKRLFGGSLPPCIITMQRHRKAYGYFHGGVWTDAKGEIVTDEIAMNPDHFRHCSTADTLSTLVHEMCHLWQHHFGKPSNGGYHNREWAGMMDAVGLVPSNTGAEGGKRIGRNVSHYIEQGGAYDKACAALLDRGFTIPWVALTRQDEAVRKKKAASKTKYTCTGCNLNVWGKPDIKVVCGECMEVMEADSPEDEGE